MIILQRKFIVGLICVTYVATLVGITRGMLAIKRQTTHQFGSDQAQAEWEQWRERARRDSHGSGPVKRKIPKSVEPPGLVLMRDHFNVCLVAGLLFGSLLYAMLIFGVMVLFIKNPRPPNDPSK